MSSLLAIFGALVFHILLTKILPGAYLMICMGQMIFTPGPCCSKARQ